MAYAAAGRLAGAISRAGGLGIFGAGSRDSPETVERESALARADDETVKFGIALMAWALETRPELLDAAIAQRPFLIAISFGSICPYIDKVHRAGILVASQVNHRRAALEASQAGADLIVAQGTEAGGHTGSVATLPLLQIVLDAVDKPVAAAGGIASGRGLAAVLAAGAVAGWIGTAFLLSPESQLSEEARRRIAASDETETIHTAVFDRANKLGWPAEFPGRALRNRFAAQWHGREDELVSNTSEMARFRQGAESKNYDVTSIYAGQAVGLLSGAAPAHDVVRRIGEDAEEILRRRTRELLA
ncbi:MAG: nitronate monooxygenase [Acidobacteriaceae bacterium]|nr:nitronate monooxygenase [Acidobacteriaceae bacterium]